MISLCINAFVTGATFLTFDAQLMLLILKCGDMPMTQPEGAWVSENRLRFWLILAKALLWQVNPPPALSLMPSP